MLADAFFVIRQVVVNDEALEQIDAGALNVRYAESGPTGGSAVLFLHAVA
jgi:hypothetical protein